MPTGDGQTGGAGSGSQNAAQTIQVGDRAYTAQDVQSMLAEQAKATQTLQQLAAVRKAAERYGLDPEGFVQQAEGSLQAISDLIDRGVIDSQGNLVQRREASPPADEDPLAALLGAPPPVSQQVQPPRGAEAALAKALQEVRGFSQSLKGEVDQLRKDNTALMRFALTEKLRKSFPDLEDEDVDLVLERARGDRTKGMADHARVVLGRKEQLTKAAQERLAKQLGIEDLSTHLNNLKQQKDGGGALQLFQGKKIILKKSDPKDKDSVTAREATAAYLDQALRG